MKTVRRAEVQVDGLVVVHGTMRPPNQWVVNTAVPVLVGRLTRLTFILNNGTSQDGGNFLHLEMA